MKCDLVTGGHKGLRQQWREMPVKSLKIEKSVQGES